MKRRGLSHVGEESGVGIGNGSGYYLNSTRCYDKNNRRGQYGLAAPRGNSTGGPFIAFFDPWFWEIARNSCNGTIKCRLTALSYYAMKLIEIIIYRHYRQMIMFGCRLAPMPVCDRISKGKHPVRTSRSDNGRTFAHIPPQTGCLPGTDNFRAHHPHPCIIYFHNG